MSKRVPKYSLRSWKGGAAEYWSVILTERRSGINSLQDLLGKIIAFEDAGSTSAYFSSQSVSSQEWIQAHREIILSGECVFQRDRLSLQSWI